jgi:hypothetical protein
MRLMNRDGQPSSYPTYQEEDDLAPYLYDEARALYSEPLCTLVAWCTQQDPSKRPALEELRNHILLHTGGLPGSNVPDRAQDLRHRVIAAGEEALQVRLNAEDVEYKLGKDVAAEVTGSSN